MPFGKATFEPTRLRIGITGPSTSGKTGSALRLAAGLKGDGRVAFIDTDGMARFYALKAGETEDDTDERFDFDILELRGSYSPLRFIDAVSEAGKIGARVLVIDTLSAMYAGDGGMMAMAAAFTGKKAKGAEWRAPNDQAMKLYKVLGTFPGHAIITFRAKLAWAKEEVGYEEAAPVPEDELKRGPHLWSPITKFGNASIIYELQTHILMNPERPTGRPVIEGFVCGRVAPPQLSTLFPPDRRISRATGAALAHYAATGEVLPLPTEEEERAAAARPNQNL